MCYRNQNLEIIYLIVTVPDYLNKNLLISINKPLNVYKIPKWGNPEDPDNLHMFNGPT